LFHETATLLVYELENSHNSRKIFPTSTKQFFYCLIKLLLKIYPLHLLHHLARYSKLVSSVISAEYLDFALQQQRKKNFISHPIIKEECGSDMYPNMLCGGKKTIV